MTQTESAILAHARRCAPAESCGFVVSTPEGERYFPCVNISGEPEAYFRMSPEDWLQAEMQGEIVALVRTPEGERYFPCVNISGEPEEYFRMAPEDWLQAEMQGEIVALVHSHPGGLPWLSEADRRLQVQSDLPWWLVCRGAIHKFRCVPHLTGRRFEHGVTDCYTLFRDAYHLAGIEMPDFHREDDWWRNFRDAYHLAGIEMPDFHRGDDWWRNGQNLYLDNMEATGFYRAALTEAQPGDVLLCCFGSSVPNHAAIYCGDGELLHHIPEQLSKRERYTDKWQRRTHSLWRHRAW
ncbi:C40 family peptidase, partial [Escherichia coli]|uniref:C40 family peptidase n=5 Tax=Enterobacteriaceae TaxID=543 RepID=UPI0003EF7887